MCSRSNDALVLEKIHRLYRHSRRKRKEIQKQAIALMYIKRATKGHDRAPSWMHTWFVRLLFFLKNAGRLQCISLRRRKTVQQSDQIDSSRATKKNIKKKVTLNQNTPYSM